MSNYEEEMFKYLTKRDAFESVHEIYRIFPDLKNRLIEQFWHLVKDEISKLLQDRGKDKWKIELSDNILEVNKYPVLWMWLNPVGLLFEGLASELDYGISIGSDESLDREEIQKHLSTIEGIKELGKHHNWLRLKKTKYDFNDYATLKQILPENRDVLAQEFAHIFFDLAVKLEEHIPTMSAMRKQQ